MSARFLGRCAATIAGVVSLVALSAPHLAAASSPAPSVSVAGVAAVPTSAPSTDEVTYTIAVGGGPIDDSVLHVAEPATLPADATSVQVDNAPAPADTVDADGAGLTIRLGTGADATDGGQLANGNHTISFTISVPTLPTGDTSISATLDYTVAGQPHSASSAAIPMTFPNLNLAVPPGFGEDKPQPLGTGQVAFFITALTNSGANTSGATLTISVPPGLIPAPDGVFVDRKSGGEDDDVSCTTASHGSESCELGSISHGDDDVIGVVLSATPSAAVGTLGEFRLSVQPDGGRDADPSNNAVTGAVRFTGVANLVVTLSPATRKVAVGDTTTLTAKIRNAGPNPAVATVGFVGAGPARHFRIVGFSGRQIRGKGVKIILGPAGSSTITASRSVTSSAGARNFGPLVLWDAGTIGVGDTRSSTVTLKAVSVGTMKLNIDAISEAGDPQCNRRATCEALSGATLTAVQPAQPPTSTPPSGPHATQPPLANTGAADTGPLTEGGVLAVVVGLLLLMLGVQRRRAIGRHR